MILQTWKIECQIIYQILNNVINFMTNVMKNWRGTLEPKDKLLQFKIERGIFQGDSFSALLFVIAIMTRNYVLRKSTGDNKFTRTQEKLNQLIYLDNIKVLAKNYKELVTLIQIRIYS